MTKEELKQEAEEYVYKALGFDKDYIKQELNRKYNPIEPWEKSEPIDPIINETLEAYLAGAEPREKRIAELKHTIATLRQEKDNVSMHAKAMEVVAKTRSDQLTKAKEVIKSFITLLTKSRTALDTKTYLMKAEQFLNSEVEK